MGGSRAGEPRAARPAAAPGVSRQARRDPPAPRRRPEGGGAGERRHPRSHRRPRPAGDRDGAILRHRSREPQAPPGRLSGRPLRGRRLPRAHGRRLLQRREHLAGSHHPQRDHGRRRAVPAHVGPLGGLRPGGPRLLRLPGLRRDERAKRRLYLGLRGRRADLGRSGGRPQRHPELRRQGSDRRRQPERQPLQGAALRRLGLDLAVAAAAGAPHLLRRRRPLVRRRRHPRHPGVEHRYPAARRARRGRPRRLAQLWAPGHHAGVPLHGRRPHLERAGRDRRPSRRSGSRGRARAAGLPAAAIDSRTGALYVVWQDGRFTPGTDPDRPLPLDGRRRRPGARPSA